MSKPRDGKQISQRQLRVGEVLRQRLSDVLHRFDFEPKILKRATLTVTQVQVSPDLRKATAFIMPLGGDNADAIVTLLNALKKYDMKRGVASLCIGGGEATAIAIERVH